MNIFILILIPFILFYAIFEGFKYFIYPEKSKRMDESNDRMHGKKNDFKNKIDRTYK